MRLAVLLMILALPAGFVGSYLYGPLGGGAFALAVTLAYALRIAHVVESERNDAR